MATREARMTERPIAGTSAKPNGPVAAAFLAASLGLFTLGLMTTLAEASPALKTALTLSNPVGPLSGKTTVAVVVWLVAWVVLGSLYRGKTIDFGRTTVWVWIFIVLGLLGTFPPFYLHFSAS